VPAKEVANGPSGSRDGTSTSLPAVAPVAGARRLGAPLAPSPAGMQDFLNVLRRRPLPAQISDECLPRVQEMLLHCIMDCYRDRIKPMQSSVQRRLRENRGGEAAAQALLPLCAREPDRYRIVPPMHGEQPVVLLIDEPPWFAGWLDSEGPETIHGHTETNLSFEVWEGLRQFVSDDANCLPVQACAAALELRQRSLPFLQNRSLTEIQTMVRLAILRGWLIDCGNCLRPAGLASDTATTSEAGTEVEVTIGAEVIAKEDGDSPHRDSGMVEEQDDLAVGLLKLMQRFPDGISLSLLKKHHIEAHCRQNLSEEATRCPILAKVFNLPQSA